MKARGFDGLTREMRVSGDHIVIQHRQSNDEVWLGFRMRRENGIGEATTKEV